VRRSNSRISRVLLFFALSYCNALTHAQSIEECEPVRTPGLSAADVDRIALNKISESTKVPISQIDLTKSMKQIDRSDLGVIGYAVFLVGTSDQLGVDFAKASAGLVKEPNGGGIYERTPIRDLLAVARSAYFANIDTPFPSARTGARYHGHLFSVAVPAPTEGWLLRRCATDEVAFVRPPTETRGAMRAAVRGIGLEPFKDGARFLQQVRSAVENNYFPNHVGNIVKLDLTDHAGAKCADVEANTELPAGSRGAAEGPTAVFARFCYDVKVPHLGYAAMFMESLGSTGPVDPAPAVSFFQGVMPYYKETFRSR